MIGVRPCVVIQPVITGSQQYDMEIVTAGQAERDFVASLNVL